MAISRLKLLVKYRRRMKAGVVDRTVLFSARIQLFKYYQEAPFKFKETSVEWDTFQIVKS